MPLTHLPDRFFDKFFDTKARRAAETIHSWILFRDGRFDHGPAKGAAWRVLLPGAEQLEHVLTLEPWFHVIDTNGRIQPKGSTVVVLAPKNSGYFSRPSNRHTLHRRVHDAMLATKPFVAPKPWISVKWPLILEPSGLVRYLAVLDWAADHVASA